MKKNYLLILVMIAIVACVPSKKLKEMSKNDIIFGSGGGFTNITKVYSLAYNGTIFKINSLTSKKEEIGKIPKKKARALFKKFISKGFDTLQFSKPGNMYSFIGYQNDSIEKKITWGGMEKVSKSVADFYQELNTLIANQ
jgi:hypothetical protein